jgi:hypothetical protein
LTSTEKNYENLVEALTNDAVSKASTSPSNPTLSLPSSSFLRPSDQNDSYRTGESESYQNGDKSDIAE